MPRKSQVEVAHTDKRVVIKLGSPTKRLDARQAEEFAVEILTHVHAVQRGK